MKKCIVIPFTVILLCIAAAIGFFVGQDAGHNEARDHRRIQCQIALSFVLQTLEPDNPNVLDDPNTRATIASNLYGAYALCPNRDITPELHNLWNAVLFSWEHIPAAQDPAVLKETVEDIKIRIGIKETDHITLHRSVPLSVSVIGALVCFLCASPFLGLAITGKNRCEPISFKNDVTALKETLQNIPEFNREVARLYIRYGLALTAAGILTLPEPITGLTLLFGCCTLGLFLVRRRYKSILIDHS